MIYRWNNRRCVICSG